MDLARLKTDKIIAGRSIRFRFVEDSDADFILKLRLDPRLNRFISPSENNLSKQVAWIQNYKHREKNGTEYYFIIETKDLEPIGTVRIYDFQDKSFCWGSWILAVGAPATAAIESALLIYHIGFDIIGFTQSHFDVRIENERVCSFHEKFGAKKVRSDHLDNFYIFKRPDYETAKLRYGKYLP